MKNVIGIMSLLVMSVACMPTQDKYMHRDFGVASRAENVLPRMVTASDETKALKLNPILDGEDQVTGWTLQGPNATATYSLDKAVPVKDQPELQVIVANEDLSLTPEELEAKENSRVLYVEQAEGQTNVDIHTVAPETFLAIKENQSQQTPLENLPKEGTHLEVLYTQESIKKASILLTAMPLEGEGTDQLQDIADHFNAVEARVIITHKGLKITEDETDSLQEEVSVHIEIPALQEDKESFQIAFAQSKEDFYNSESLETIEPLKMTGSLSSSSFLWDLFYNISIPTLYAFQPRLATLASSLTPRWVEPLHLEAKNAGPHFQFAFGFILEDRGFMDLFQQTSQKMEFVLTISEITDGDKETDADESSAEAVDPSTPPANQEAVEALLNEGLANARQARKEANGIRDDSQEAKDKASDLVEGLVTPQDENTDDESRILGYARDVGQFFEGLISDTFSHQFTNDTEDEEHESILSNQFGEQEDAVSESVQSDAYDFDQFFNSSQYAQPTIHQERVPSEPVNYSEGFDQFFQGVSDGISDVINKEVSEPEGRV